MKLKEAAGIIKEGWVRRRKGFRVHFERRVGSEWVADVFPDQDESPIQSEIAIWEYARRFAEAAPAVDTGATEGAMVNIYVVDDLGEPVRFYGTHEYRILNPLEHEK